MPKGRLWTRAEDEYLMANTNIGRWALAEKIGRTEGSISNRIHMLRNAGSNKKKNKLWSEADLQYIRDNRETMTYQEIAMVLGRTYGATRHQGRRMEISERADECGYNYVFSECQKKMLCRFMKTLDEFAEIAGSCGQKPDAGKFMDCWHQSGGV